VDPVLLRGGFRIGFLIAIVALITLPFQRPESAEFVVTVLALVMGALFAGLVVLVGRLSSPPIPRSGDKASASRYNNKIPKRENGRDRWKKGSDTK
jgi:hypothetical protein